MIDKLPVTADDMCGLIQKVRELGARERHGPTKVIAPEGLCFVAPAFRRDGVGIQALLRICVMNLAHQSGATYLHVPFLRLAHKEYDFAGALLTAKEWLVGWEYFLSLGYDEYWITDVATSIGDSALSQALADPSGQFGDPRDDARKALPDRIRLIRSHSPAAARVWTFSLGLCRQANECQLYFDEEVIRKIRSKFHRNSYTPKTDVFDPLYLDVAIHIRRGDVWNACQSGSMEEMYRNKLVTQDYYVDLIAQLRGILADSPRRIRFHIFSDGKPEDFDKFEFLDDVHATLAPKAGGQTANVIFHLKMDAMDTLYHMIMAPVFFPGKSTFSVLASALRYGPVIYDDQICEFYNFDHMRPYMKTSRQYYRLDGLAGENCLALLHDSSY